jgi:hypothetical protein
MHEHSADKTTVTITQVAGSFPSYMIGDLFFGTSKLKAL